MEEEDIRNVLVRRFPAVEAVLCPVQVQGESAPEETDYESVYTVGIQGVDSPEGDDWFELRAVQDAAGENFALLLYR